MRIRQLFLFVFCFMLLSGDVVYGASNSIKGDRTKVTDRETSNWKTTARRLTIRYEGLLAEIRVGGKTLKNSMSALRAYYVYTPYYDPFSQNLIDEMTEYAYIVDTSEDREQVNIALGKYRDLVNKHVAHLGVMSYALTLARLDIRFGDKAFFKTAKDAIENSWFGLSQPGSSPERAYKIVTYAEEEYILSTYNAKVLNSEVYQVVRNFYDVRDVVTDSGENMQIFFDVTDPIRTVQIRQAIREKEKKVTIPLQ